MGFSNIHPTIRDKYWSLWCQEWSSHQYQSFFFFFEVVEVIEPMEAVEAVEVIEAVEILKPGKLPVRTLKSSRLLNSAVFWCFENNYFWVESWNIILHFCTFSVGGCWGQLMSFLWKLVDGTQMSNPPEATRHNNSIKLLILLPLRANSKSTFHYETPCK